MKRIIVSLSVCLVATTALARVDSASARVQSNPNVPGTFVSDDTLEVHPRFENMWTGRANVNGGKWSGNLAIIPNPDFRAWVMFDLSPIPDSATITSATLHYTTFPGRDSASSLWRDLSNDPLTASGHVLYAECGSAPVISDTAYDPVSGPVTRILNPTGIAAVQDGLVADRAAFGWQRHASDGWRYVRGIETPGQEPFLVVTFNPPVALGSERPQPAAWNRIPTVIRDVLLMPETSSTGYDASYILLDISGRRVMDLAPGTNDIRPLSPGVYFVHQERPGCDRRVLVLR